jgi:hypothetical protein
MAKKENLNNGIVNPFEQGVTYASFLEALNGSEIKEYLKDLELSKEDIEWIEIEIENYKNNNKLK